MFSYICFWGRYVRAIPLAFLDCVGCWHRLTSSVTRFCRRMKHKMGIYLGINLCFARWFWFSIISDVALRRPVIYSLMRLVTFWLPLRFLWKMSPALMVLLAIYSICLLFCYLKFYLPPSPPVRYFKTRWVCYYCDIGNNGLEVIGNSHCATNVYVNNRFYNLFLSCVGCSG